MATIGSLGTDPDYASLYAGRHDPRLLMAQKLMELDKAPATNSTQSSFWANLLNQGGRGLLGGYMMNQVKADAETERRRQEDEAKEFEKKLSGGPPGSGGGTAPPAPGPVQASLRADAGGGSLPPEQQQAIVTAATQGTMVPPHVLHALITQESNWNPAAKGKGSDFGLGQVTASTAGNPGYGLPPLSDADRADPNKNAAWAARYLEARGRAAGLTRPEDWNDPAKLALALRAYNGGGDPNYVANVTRRMGKSADPLGSARADASPAPGSNIDALMAGVDQPKPRGIQLAAMLGNGNTATDAPTPILPAQPDMAAPIGSAVADAPAPYFAALPPPPRPSPVPPPAADVSPAGPAALTPPPAPTPPLDNPIGRADPGTLANINGLPLPNIAATPAPDAAEAPYVPAGVPAPQIPADLSAPAPAALSPPPEPTPTIPNPQAGADPGALANLNGLPPPPDAAVVPRPEPPLVPPPALVRAQVAPQYGPPKPPRGVQLAKPLVGDPTAGGATEALNTASLAAARRGENFVPGAADRLDRPGPTGQQLAAPLQEPTTPDEAAAYSDARGPSGGPTGPQLAAPLQPPGALDAPAGPLPLLTPASAPADAAGGQTKGPAPAQPDGSSGRDLQAQADWYLQMAREAQKSTTPRVRAQAGILEAQGQALQRRIDIQTGRDERFQQQLFLREEGDRTRADTAAGRAQQHEWDKQDRATEAEKAAQRTEDRELALKGMRWKPGSNRTVLTKLDSEVPPTSDFGNTEDAKSLAIYTDLFPVMAGVGGRKPTPEQAAQYEGARNRLLTIKRQINPTTGQVVETPGQLPNLSKVYDGATVPGETQPAEQKLPPGAYRTGSGSIVYPGPQQPVPEKVTEQMLTNVDGLRQVQGAVEALRKNPNAVGPIQGFAPSVTNWFDVNGVPTRAMVQAIGSVQIHNISGGNVTASETPRLKPWIPTTEDPQAVALAKLDRFAAEYRAILADRYEVHGPDNNYQKNTVVEKALLAAPMEYGDDATYEGMKRGQVYRSPDGQLRTKQ
jgi:hypothetical protein